MTVTWYRGTTQLYTNTYTVDSSTFFADANVTAYNKIVVTFTNMTRASRFLKIYSISDGTTREFYNEEILDVDIIESNDITCSELPISEATITLMPISTIGVIFQRTLPMTIYRKKNGAYQLFGKYYISSYSTDNKKLKYKIVLSDVLSLLENQTYLGGIINAKPSVVLGELLSGYEFTYSGNDSQNLNGYLPIMNKREALRQICQAIGCLVIASETDKIKIVPRTKFYIGTLRKKNVYSYSVTQDSITTDMEYKYSYLTTTNSNTQVLFSDTISGTTTIYFSSPVYNLSITGGTIVESNINYATITGSGAVSLSGKVYEKAERVYTKSNPYAISTDLKKTLTINSTLWYSYSTYDSLSMIPFINEKVNFKTNYYYYSTDAYIMQERGYTYSDLNLGTSATLHPKNISFSLKQPSLIVNVDFDEI